MIKILFTVLIKKERNLNSFLMMGLIGLIMKAGMKPCYILFKENEILFFEVGMLGGIKGLLTRIDVDDIEKIDLDREKLQNNEYLQESIENIVWEQVQLQLAAQIGEEFINENQGQTLDLRKEAHIQTAENFEKGNFATHNRDVNYQERYDKWQDNFTTNKKGERVLKKDARKFFDKGRDMGSAAIHKDHTVSIKEQLNDIEMATFFSKEQVKEFANSSKNLHDLDASANMSKGDKTMKEFLNSERNGLKPEERFNIDRKQLEKDDQEAREELKNRKAENENIAIQSGKKSRRKEALKVTGKALKAAVLQLLTEFLREIVKKFISWLGEKEKNFGTFIAKVKEAISNFMSNLSHHVLGVGQSMVTMLATSIIGPVVGTFMQVWTFIQQGWRSLTDAIDYLKNPENKNKSTSVKMLEVGKIIVAGVTAAGAIVLSSAIGATLLSIFPPLGVEIPLLGSLSGLIGTFMGATVAGIAGAFVLKLIDQMIVDKQIDELTNKKIDKYNNKLIVQDQMNAVGMALVQVDKMKSLSQMGDRHQQAAEIMRDELSFLLEEKEKNDNEFTEIDALLAELTD